MSIDYYLENVQLDAIKIVSANIAKVAKHTILPFLLSNMGKDNQPIPVDHATTIDDNKDKQLVLVDVMDAHEKIQVNKIIPAMMNEQKLVWIIQY